MLSERIPMVDREYYVEKIKRQIVFWNIEGDIFDCCVIVKIMEQFYLC